MGPEWAEKPLMVQVALVEANWGRSHLLVVVAVGELETDQDTQIPGRHSGPS